MAANKYIRGFKEYSVSNGKYEIAYRKNTGEWVVISELEVIIPVDRKADLGIRVSGKETAA